MKTDSLSALKEIVKGALKNPNNTNKPFWRLRLTWIESMEKRAPTTKR